MAEVNYIFSVLEMMAHKGQDHAFHSCPAALAQVCRHCGRAQPLITGSLTLFSVIGTKEAREESEGEGWKC